MPTYTPEGIAIEPVQVSVSRVPAPTDPIAEVTVTGHFDWQFWVGIVAGLGALYVLSRSMRRLPTRRRLSRRLR